MLLLMGSQHCEPRTNSLDLEWQVGHLRNEAVASHLAEERSGRAMLYGSNMS